MEREVHTRGTSGRASARVLAPWVALLLVVGAIWMIVSDYRGATTASESTSTVEASSTTSAADGAFVRVLSDGLNLRAEPSTTSPVVKVLKANEQLPLLEEGTGWYRVVDSAGAEGWVAAGGRYTELVRP